MPAADTVQLLQAARAAQANAHAPYSRYPVGAALATPDGRVFAGCNVENAAYPSGTCAEAGAIAAMVAAGAREIADLVVVGNGPEPTTPCGDCRQRIREFATAATRVHAAGAQGVVRSFTVDELLPQSFGPGHLRPAP
ncbi:cytidine deaminase [Pseudorhodoferax sp.]|uniref:cytidine deaminase n=1 Tax=Pseudorhodoferax sp. TaxID=1993553 RepID=UPI002DD66829|nr:cytidine deaminase [Pseudorhodoferax sp.]